LNRFERGLCGFSLKNSQTTAVSHCSTAATPLSGNEGIKMKANMEALKRLCQRVEINLIADVESATRQADCCDLARLFEAFAEQYWYVWVNYGDGIYKASVLSSEELSKLAMQGKQLELKSGPLATWDEAKQCMDSAVAEDRRLAEELGPYKPPPKGKVEWGRGGDGDHEERPASATPVVDVYWGEHVNPKHTQRFHLDVSPGKRLWVLWQEYVNASGNSPRPWVIAHMAKRGISTDVAVRKLLTYALEEERDECTKRFDGVSALGCISATELEQIAADVWKEEE
jgi:hypothetical protein